MHDVNTTIETPFNLKYTEMILTKYTNNPQTHY